MRNIVRAAFAAALVAGCGGGGNDATPTVVPGGGVSSGGIDGEVNVFVIDSRTDAPLAGASVTVGTVTGTTDATGLFTFTDVKGPQTISATLAGYAAATWFGADGANVTIPLTANGPDAVDSAHVEGTIAGWDALPAPATDHYYLAFIVYSLTDELGAPENEIPQGTTAGFPNNACIRAPMLSQCDWQLETRTGPQMHVAVILDADSKGTITNFDDDTFVVYGYAVETGIDLDDGQTVTGETLTMIPDTDLIDVTLAFPAAPSGLDEVGGFPVIDLGDTMVALPFPPLSPTATTTRVPALTGDFAGGSYMMIGTARPMMMEAPSTTTLARNVNLATQFTLPAWLSTPASISVVSDTVSFTGAAGAALHTAEVRSPNGDVVWSVALLDGSVTFAPPAAVTLPVGALTVAVTAIDIADFDTGDFSIAGIQDRIARISDNQLDFTR